MLKFSWLEQLGDIGKQTVYLLGFGSVIYATNPSLLVNK
jgi:hypothetical protein